ncbi:MAG: B12-binding domain-containing radical SAM protein [Exilispira sp.]
MDINQSKKNFLNSNILKDISFCFINPPVLDYALYDLFAVPLGTLKSINLLKFFGADVFYLDALNKDFDSSFFESGSIKPTIKKDGTGKYWKKRIEPPEILKFYNREFYRFGIGFEKIIEILKFEIIKRKKKFDFIIISSVFTYHYLGIKILIDFLKENFIDTKIILAGIYPKIIENHAKSLGADYVFNKDALKFIEFIFDITSKDKKYLELLKSSGILFYNTDNKSCDILPDWEIIDNLRYGVIRITTGCPYNCPYCASRIISGKYARLNFECSLIQLKYFVKRNIFNIAFYDDALLIDENHFLNFLKQANKISNNFNFYLPNAIHIAKATLNILKAMKNFKMIRFGLESLKFGDDKYGNKFKIDQLQNLINNLNDLKIQKNVLSFYILVGLPYQTYDEVEYTIKMALKLGIKPRIAEFSPIPGTLLFEDAKNEIIKNKKDFINIEEPLFQNPRIFCYVATEFSQVAIKKLHSLIY